MAGVGRKPNTGQVAGPGPGDPAYMTMVARAKALIPQLRDRASKTEDLRRLLFRPAFFVAFLDDFLAEDFRDEDFFLPLLFFFAAILSPCLVIGCELVPV